MRIHGIGVNLPVTAVSDPDRFSESLDWVRKAGLTVAEIPIHAMGVIRHGHIDEQRLARYAQVANEADIDLTTHAPFQLNLFATEGRETERRVLEASLHVSHAIGASVMTYHAGRYIQEEQFPCPHHWPSLSDTERTQLLEMEREHLYCMGDLAKTYDIRIGVENTRPYLDCPGYAYAEIPNLLVRQVSQIAHPNIGITLDTGHLHLVTRAYDLDLQYELKNMSSLVTHLHVHDNFGIRTYAHEKDQGELIAKGRGDMHAPIGDCDVPIHQIINALPEFSGYWIHEIRDRYRNRWNELLVLTKSILDSSNLQTVLE